MPRVHQKAMEYAAADFIKQVKVAAIQHGMENTKEIASYVGIPVDTLRERFRNPLTLKFPDIYLLVGKLKMDMSVLEIFTRGDKTS